MVPSTPSNPTILNDNNGLSYFMNTTSTYAKITSNIEIDYDLTTTSEKVLFTDDNVIIKRLNSL